MPRFTAPPSRLPAPPTFTNRKKAVFIDGSALYLASRNLHESKQLDYRQLVDLLLTKIPGLAPATPHGKESRWVMWTSASPDNAGQSRFLDFAERELHWTVRRFAPSDSFMVEPASVLGLASDSRAATRLVRFDASIAFAIGRLADSHQITLISDSFALAEPLMRAGRLHETRDKNYLAFFGRALDPRWQRVLRIDQGFVPQFVDLDEDEDTLFGISKKEVVKTIVNDDDSLLF